MEQAYVYRWTELSTGKWYIGSRTKKNCHPFDGYICSSKIVKPLIKKNPENWIREILFVGEALDAIAYESKLLTELDAKNNEDSYNLHNQDMNFHGIRRPCPEHQKQMLRELHTGRVSPNKGNKCPNVGLANKKRTGIKRPQHSIFMTGRRWNYKQSQCPHCDKIGGGGNMQRYHFDNCKFKE